MYKMDLYVIDYDEKVVVEGKDDLVGATASIDYTLRVKSCYQLFTFGLGGITA